MTKTTVQGLVVGASKLGSWRIKIDPGIWACGRAAVPDDTGRPSHQSSAERICTDDSVWFLVGRVERANCERQPLGGMGTWGHV